MSDPVVKHQIFNYDPPLRFTQVPGNAKGNASSDGDFIETPHWHRDLEITYCLHGHAEHIIDGKIYTESPGHLIVTNCEAIHYVHPDPAFQQSPEIVAYVIIIDRDFLDANFPQYKDYYFCNSQNPASEDMVHCIDKIQEFSDRKTKGHYDLLYMESLTLELLYYLCQEGTVLRNDTEKISSLKSEDRIRAVLQYVETHYQEPMTETDIAEKFYFSPSYFSHYFKKCTGETFLKYLRDYRLEEARAKLINSDTPVYRIAMECGFSDDRRLIIAFKQKYGITPLQYRKNCTS